MSVAIPVGLPQLATSLPTVERAAPGATPSSGVSFAERLEQVVGDVDAAQRNGEAMATSFASGEQNDIHGTMIALQKADIQLRFAANVRNRLIEAYREIMRMGA